MAPKEIKVTLEREKETKRFVKFSIPTEEGEQPDLSGAFYVRKGTDAADAKKLSITIKAQ